MKEMIDQENATKQRQQQQQKTKMFEMAQASGRIAGTGDENTGQNQYSKRQLVNVILG